MLGRLFSTTIAKALGAATIALLIACIALGLWGRAGHRSAAQWREHAGVEASNHRQTKTNYRAAQAAAAERERAARAETTRQYAALAKEADDANKDADHWRAAARRFADNGGLWPQAGGGAGSSANDAPAPGQSDPAPGGDRSGTAAVVWLSRSDFDTLSDNTARLLRVRSWGSALIAAGLAEPEEQ